VCVEFRCISFPTSYDCVTHFVRRTMLSEFRDENLILLPHNFQTAVVAVVRSRLLSSYEFRSQMARVLQFSTLCKPCGLQTNIFLLEYQLPFFFITITILFGKSAFRLLCKQNNHCDKDSWYRTTTYVVKFINWTNTKLKLVLVCQTRHIQGI
jgi:hypothetical protein